MQRKKEKKIVGSRSNLTRGSRGAIGSGRKRWRSGVVVSATACGPLAWRQTRSTYCVREISNTSSTLQLNRRPSVSVIGRFLVCDATQNRDVSFFWHRNSRLCVSSNGRMSFLRENSLPSCALSVCRSFIACTTTSDVFGPFMNSAFLVFSFTSGPRRFASRRTRALPWPFIFVRSVAGVCSSCWDRRTKTNRNRGSAVRLADLQRIREKATPALEKWGT